VGLAGAPRRGFRYGEFRVKVLSCKVLKQGLPGKGNIDHTIKNTIKN